MTHDAFQWWADIWIPLAVGATAVLVSVVALLVSSRATKLAHAVEQQRELAEGARAIETDRLRLQDMAIGDARILHRYAAEAYRPSSGWYTATPIGQPQQRTPFQVAQLDALVALQQSLVPGAGALLDLTQLDVENEATWIPEGAEGILHGFDVAWANLHTARADRMYERIRKWAMDPIASAPKLATEHNAARADLDTYLRAGQPIPWRNDKASQ